MQALASIPTNSFVERNRPIVGGCSVKIVALSCLKAVCLYECLCESEIRAEAFCLTNNGRRKGGCVRET